MADPPKFQVLLKAVSAQAGVTLDAAQRAQLERHFHLLQRWNAKTNLTAIRDPREIAERHFGESLFLSGCCRAARSIADIGSGAGFPGIPMAIARPGTEFTLIEASARKMTFLKEASRNLDNVSVFYGRCESLTRKHDWAVGRGLNLNRLLPAMGKVGRRIALLVGEETADWLRWQHGFLWEDSLPVPWGERRVVLIGKQRGL